MSVSGASGGERARVDRDVSQRAARAVHAAWLAIYYEEPIELVRGEGRHVWDADGNRYLDFFGGILTTMIGHDVPEVVDALREQAGSCCTPRRCTSARRWSSWPSGCRRCRASPTRRCS